MKRFNFFLSNYVKKVDKKNIIDTNTIINNYLKMNLIILYKIYQDNSEYTTLLLST